MRFVFFHYFVQGSLLRDEWNETWYGEAGREDDKALCTSYEEAFAMVILKNNYYSWLLAFLLYTDTCSGAFQLVTDYHSDEEREGSILLTDYFEMQFDLEKDTDMEEDQEDGVDDSVETWLLTKCDDDDEEKDYNDDDEEEEGVLLSTNRNDRYSELKLKADEYLIKHREKTQSCQQGRLMMEAREQVLRDVQRITSEGKHKGLLAHESLEAKVAYNSLKKYTYRKTAAGNKGRGYSVEAIQFLKSFNEASRTKWGPDTLMGKRFNKAFRVISKEVHNDEFGLDKKKGSKQEDNSSDDEDDDIAEVAMIPGRENWISL